jgi:hypothetical protein
LNPGLFVPEADAMSTAPRRRQGKSDFFGVILSIRLRPFTFHGTRVPLEPGAYSTIMSDNAMVVKIYNAANSISKF